ncbi:MAG: methyltransferase domain-containing protein [bacterium]
MSGHAADSGPERGACRLCGAPLERIFVDLGMSPLCETYPGPDELDHMEPFYPLRVHVCQACLLVQLKEYVPPDTIFREYPYFSSYSTSWLEHARRFARTMVADLELDDGSLVVELASNDGYLLQYFREAGVQVLGVEPARNVARAAEEKGIPTLAEFFGRELGRALADEGRRADLLVANNVLAHVPDIHDFVGGIPPLLAPGGVVTMEFPHLFRLVEGNQFDTIYHEHFSYLSLLVVERLFQEHGLRVYDVRELPTHGGSLRVYAEAEAREGRTTEGRPARPESDGLLAARALERKAGMHDAGFYRGFKGRVQRARNRLVRFLMDEQEADRRVVGYGAPGKGNTLLNYCGIRPDLLEFTVDRNPVKQGRFLPGTRIPIHEPERIRSERPDVVLILPWNLKDEIMDQLAYIREWGGRFAVPIPELEVL